MDYWWVNQKQTQSYECAGGYLWAPLKDRAGHTNVHWELMDHVKPGDLIFSYANAVMGKVAVARTASYLADRPSEQPFKAWSIKGRKIDATYYDLPTPLSNNELQSTLGELLMGSGFDKPLTSVGGGKQAYLFSLTNKVGDTMLALTGFDLGDTHTLNAEGTAHKQEQQTSPSHKKRHDDNTVPVERQPDSEHFIDTPSLREVGLSPRVSVRIRNVFRAIPLGDNTVDVSAANALNAWPRIEHYLMNQRSFGQTSADELHSAIRKISNSGDACGSIKHRTNNTDPATIPTTTGTPLIPYLLENRLIGSQYLAQALSAHSINHPLMQVTCGEAINNFGAIATWLNDLPFMGTKRQISFRKQSLDIAKLIAANESCWRMDIDGLRLIDIGISDSAPARLRNYFLVLPAHNPISFLNASSALSNWDGLEYYLYRQQSLGRDSTNAFRYLLEKHSTSSDSSGCINSQTTSVAVSRTMLNLNESPLAYESWRLILDVAIRSSKRKVIQELGDKSCIQVARLNNSDEPGVNDIILAANSLLIQTAEWMHIDADDQLRLNETGSKHFKDWFSEPYSSHSNEWLVLRLLCKRAMQNWTNQKLLAAMSDQEVFTTLMSITKGNPDSLRLASLSPHLSLIVEAFADVEFSSITQPSEIATPTLAAILKHNLNDRVREIVMSHFGQPPSRPTTLDKIGQRLGITGERVRQLQSKWKQRNSDLGLNKLAAQHVEANENMWLQSLQAKASDDSYESLYQLGDLLTSDQILILNAADVSPKDWLDQHAMFADGRIAFRMMIDSDLQESICFIQNVVDNQISLPQLATRIEGYPDHFPESALFALSSQDNSIGLIQTPEGIVIAESNNAHNTRVAGIISAYETHSDWLLSDQELWNVTTEGIDGQSLLGKWRVTSDSLRKLPHKYRRIPRVGWLDIDDLSLSSDYQPEARPLFVPRAVMGSTDSALGNENQRYELYELISNKGVLGAKDIMTMWGDHLGHGRGESAGFLLDDPYFVRAHPGRTGCLNSEGCLVNKDLITKQLTCQDCLGDYLLLRTAGFGPHDFPAWDHLQLQAWIDWVKINVPKSTQESLITQLENDLSNRHGVSNSVLRLDPMKDNFKAQQQCRRPSDVMIPSAEEFFRLLTLGTRFGFINFYMANCSSPRQWYSHTSVSWLAMMTACGAVSPTSHWQNCHYATHKCHELLHSLIPALREHGELTWDCHPATRTILDLIMSSWNVNIDTSWINKTQFTRLLSAMMDPQRRRGPRD